MQLKVIFKKIFIITIILVIFFLITIIFLAFYLPGHVYTYFYDKTFPSVVGIPVRLKIPKINIDAKIISLGVDKDGSIEAPSGPKDVGWFETGTRPGDNGNAIIDGHYGYWKDGEESVFDDLNKLRKGDQIYVEDENGIFYIFVVKKIMIYDASVDASNIFNSADKKSHLNLITCEGDWNATQKTYSNRLVIFADKE